MTEPTRLASVSVPTQWLTELLSIVERNSHRRAVLLTSWTDIDTLVCVAILNDEIIHLPVAEDRRPIDGVDVAQLWVPLDADGSANDPPQVPQSQIFQIVHFEHHQGVVEEQYLAADGDQVWKDVAQRLHAVDTVKQQIVGDFSQVWERERLKLLRSGVVHKKYLEVTLNDGAVFQTVELTHCVPDVNTVTHCSKQQNTTINYNIT